jgi:hypothetical protein
LSFGYVAFDFIDGRREFFAHIAGEFDLSDLAYFVEY